MTKNQEDPILALMRSVDGQDVMLSTDFNQLFDKLLEILAAMLSKTSLILEDKIIIENTLAILVGILLFK